MNRLKRSICLILSMCILAAPAVLSFTASGAESIDSLESQLKELQRQSEEYQKELDRTQSDINEKEQYSDVLVKKIAVLDEKIDLTHQRISELNTGIAEKQAEIDQANADIEDQMETLKSRIRDIYMAGNVTDLEIILGAKDFSDFIDKMSLVRNLSKYDKGLIDGIKEEMVKICEQKDELESDKQTLETEEQALENDQNELNSLLAENEEILRNLYAASEEAQDAIEHAHLESKEVEDQISAYYAEQKRLEEIRKQQQAAQNNNSSSSGSSGGSSSGGSSSGSSGSSSSGSSGSSSGGSGITVSPTGYQWPVPGFYYLSSQWNEDRNTYNHGAIDIAGSGIMGATVIAADSGTVINSYSGCFHNWGKNGSCGCGGGYGNYVMIDHGNGKMTVYAHLSSVAVSSGQRVSKGQVVGYVGSTGESTGPHLHFECRLYGVKYNPMIEFR